MMAIYIHIFIRWYCFDDIYGTIIMDMYWWYQEVAYGYGIHIYIWCRDDMRIWFYDDGYVVLRAPMDAWDRGRIWRDDISFHQDCVGDDSSRRMVGVSVWYITYVRHIRVNTSVGSVYIIFGFHNIKIYVYIMF